MAFTSYNVDNDRKFQAAIENAIEKTGDLRIPLTQIQQDFHKSQRAIFTLQSAGQYPDFKNERSKRQKQRAVGFTYPLLVRTGALARSMTEKSDINAISEIVDKNTLFLGTRLTYGVYHQSDEPRKKIPLRKFLFIGPEAVRFAKGPTAGRPNRWLNIVNTYVLDFLKRDFEVKND